MLCDNLVEAIAACSFVQLPFLGRLVLDPSSYKESILRIYAFFGSERHVSIDIKQKSKFYCFISYCFCRSWSGFGYVSLWLAPERLFFIRVAIQPPFLHDRYTEWKGCSLIHFLYSTIDEARSEIAITSTGAYWLVKAAKKGSSYDIGSLFLATAEEDAQTSEL